MAFEIYDQHGADHLPQDVVTREDTDRILKALKSNSTVVPSFDPTVAAANNAQFWELAKSRPLNRLEFRSMLDTMKPSPARDAISTAFGVVPVLLELVLPDSTCRVVQK